MIEERKERILFIVPPYLSYDNFMNPAFNERTVVKKSGSYGSVVTDMPIGLMSLSAYLKKHSETEIKLIDFNVILNQIESFKYHSFLDFFEDILTFKFKDLVDYKPTIVAISTLFTPSYYNMLIAAFAAKNIFADALIIAGGGVPTNMYKEIFNDTDCIDALCFGEAEKPLLGLVKADDKNEFFKNNPSWITKEKVEKHQLFKYDFIEDLDEIPFYDYSILDLSGYGLSPTISSYASFEKKSIIFHVSTSRGCPFRCCYCASHTVHGRKMRYHSVARIKEDLMRLKEQYGANRIGFQDDQFMADKKRALEIINIAKELKMEIFFQSGLALYALDRKMLETIKEAGLSQLVLAIESGSNRVLKEVMHKPLNLSIIKRVIADCRELGLDTDANILIGLPGETKQDIEDTRTFLKTLDATWFRIYIATPLIGSEMFDICLKKNYLKGSHIGSDFKRAVVETEDFNSDYIQEKAYALNLELNFVGNSDFRLKNYEKALQGFENTIRVKSDHAFAYYYAAKCYDMLGDTEKAQRYMNTAKQIVKEYPFWRNYANMFRVPI
ncbi:MAG: radical SAM protein [Patescibacteria group bacterium]